MQIEGQNRLNMGAIHHQLFNFNVMVQRFSTHQFKIISGQHLTVEQVLYDSALKLFKWYKTI